uniref:Methyltransferase domain-containing protein n=1 Tax=Candidatus Kentrum sp. FW TaxID=2126338 RepID=A0A450T470_9GAMM|nr:MAG: hypothetical protein BECKFW1821C_GA0114237_10018 [Candidatus Kentron sp. FW]
MNKALKILSQAVDQFPRNGIATGEQMKVFHAVTRSIHDLSAAILNCEETGIERTDILKQIESVRRVWADSPFFKRIQEWPTGYQGDFETIEYLYHARNPNSSETSPQTFDASESFSNTYSVANIIEKWILSSFAAQQHRNKVQWQADTISEIISRNPTRSNILSLAAGGNLDIELAMKRWVDKTSLVINDIDEKAIAFSRKRLSAIVGNCHFLPGNVLRIFRKAQSFGPFDLVLAGGLFDYLKDEHAVFVLRNVYTKLMKRKGTFCFTNIAKNNPYRPLIEYVGNWFLLERDETDILELTRQTGIKDSEVIIERNKTELSLLVRITNLQTQ